MKEKKVKDKSMFWFFIKMVFVFIIIAEIIIDTILVGGAINGVLTAKYGLELLVEAFRAAFILIVVLLFGNKYIFTEKRMKLKDSLILGWPIILIGIYNFIMSIMALKGEKVNPNAIINCAVFCLLIGIFEEFLCRGWLQNEFIERFKKNKHQVVASIICASLVFGIMHITNFWNTSQGFFVTLMQIIQALSAGILFGAIYYKSKNIWSVVFLHAFYDFALFLGEVPLIRDCQLGVYTTAVTIYEVFSSLLISTIFIGGAVLILRSEEGLKLFRTDSLKEIQNRKIAIGILVLIAIVFIDFPIPGKEQAQMCFSYDEKTYPNEYRVTEVTNSKLYYEIENKESIYSISQEEGEKGKFYMRDTTGDTIYFDFTIENLYVLEQSDHFEVVGTKHDLANTTVYFFRLYKDEMNDSHEYLTKVKSRVKKYDLPMITSIGHIEDLQTGEKSIYLRGQYQNEFIIDSYARLFLITKE